MVQRENLSVNRIIKPDLHVTEFIQFAAEISCGFVELRNDLTDPRILGEEALNDVLAKCRDSNVGVLTINALQRFNDPVLLEEKKTELKVLLDEASAINCPNIVLCPVNDPEDRRSPEDQKKDLVGALEAYAPLFENAGMIGLIEPLGFEICSVRYKKQAVEAIRESDFSSLYKIVHDTFHHYLSGEKEIFPEYTGLVHVSGVLAGKKKEEITDADRILVDERDVMENKDQVKSLLAKGCKAVFSYEPFSPEIQKMGVQKLKEGVVRSKNFLFG